MWSAWKYLKCKLGVDCSHLEEPNIASRLVGYLNPSITTPATILLAVVLVAVSAVLVYFKPYPRQMFQKVKSALRMGPGASKVTNESAATSEQTVHLVGNPIQHKPPFGVAVFPPEIYEAKAKMRNIRF